MGSGTGVVFEGDELLESLFYGLLVGVDNSVYLLTSLLRGGGGGGGGVSGVAACNHWQHSIAGCFCFRGLKFL